MRVAMLGWEFPPFQAGGLGVHCYHLSQELAARGVRLDFFMPDVKEAPSQVAWMRLHRIPDPLVGPYSTMGEKADKVGGFARAVEVYNEALVAAFPRKERFDLLHAHDWITARAAMRLGDITGTPVLLSMHSTEWDRSGGFWPQRWISEIERAACRRADGVIAVSGYTREQVVRDYGVEPGRIHVVHNGVEASRYDAPAAARAYGGKAPLVLFLSRLTPQKGCLQFLHMAERLVSMGEDAHFALGGTGPLFQELAAEVAERRLGHRINLLGFVPEEEVPGLYRRSAAYVLPSFSEPFGISALEAAASGLPVVLSRSTGVAEVLPHALQADYWDVDLLAEYVRAVVRHPSLARAMGQSARAVAHRMTWARCAERTEQVYRTVLAGSQGRAA